MHGSYIPKIVSGGQPGANRSALDWALSRGIECGGWCPQGRKAEELGDYEVVVASLTGCRVILQVGRLRVLRHSWNPLAGIRPALLGENLAERLLVIARYPASAQCPTGPSENSSTVTSSAPPQPQSLPQYAG